MASKAYMPIVHVLNDGDVALGCDFVTAERNRRTANAAFFPRRLRSVVQFKSLILYVRRTTNREVRKLFVPTINLYIGIIILMHVGFRFVARQAQPLFPSKSVVKHLPPQ